MIAVTATAGGAAFHVKVVPGASRDRIAGALGDALKIAVARPPSGGEANRALVKLLAKALNLPPQHIEIYRGHTSPRKQILVSNISVETLSARLEALCE